MEYDNGEYVFKTDNNGNYIKANDYSVSTIRQYLNGTYNSGYVYKYSTFSTKREIRSDENFGYSSMLKDYNIANDNAIYTQIVKRSLKDMYKGMSADYNYDINDYVYNNIELPIANASDAFWLLSMKEIVDLHPNEQSDEYEWSVIWYEMYWWLRSPFDNSGVAHDVDDTGSYSDCSDVFRCNNVARAAFQLSI